MPRSGKRPSAEKKNSQADSLHGQAPSSSGTGQAASGGLTNSTPCRPPRDQSRDSQEERMGIRASQTTLKPRPADATGSSVPRPPSTSSSDLLRRLTMARASWATSSVSPTPSSVRSNPPSTMITSMVANRRMQHDSKDTGNFYEDDDSEGTIDYPSTPPEPESNSDSSSVWSNQSDRSSRGGTPAYDQDGWRSGDFLTSSRR